jgi:hypothetical protein
MTRSSAAIALVSLASLMAFGAANAAAPTPETPRATRGATRQDAPNVTVILKVNSDPARAYTDPESLNYKLVAAKDLQLPYVTAKWQNFRYAVTVAGEEYWLRATDVTTKPTDCKVYRPVREVAVGANGARGFGEACAQKP